VLQVHVQYFADKSTMLPVDNHDQDPNAGQSFRSTANSEYLTYVGDMPTSFGIPWAIDVNYSQATITLPAGANYARVLICGGGSGDAAQWRDFMPNDPYAGNNYPEECHWPLIITMIFDLGVPLILFGFDAAIAGGQAVSSYKTAVSVALSANHTLCLQALDGFATLGELGAYLGNKGVNTSSPADAIGTLGAAIPQLLWGSDTGTGANYEMFGRAALLVTEMIVQYAITKAIPVMGEVFGALAAAGDLAQMMTCAAEMSAAPWVIDNDVRVTYAATITMSHDTQDSSWPRGAGGVTYTLSCVTDGSDTTRSFTDSIPDGFKDDIVVSIPDVAISKTVQYVLRVVDADDNLVGTAQSDVLANDDTTKLPSAVQLVLKEQEKPLTAKTTFVRQDTLQHNASMNAYHWQSDVTVSATRTTKAADLLELDLVTVGTVSGMAGSIWRANDANKSYYVRSIPTVEGKTPGVVPQLLGPYTRRPHLVYDRLSPDLSSGNNFFLEPQGSGGYLVRRLTLGGGGGSIHFTPNQAWGRFLQDLTAVTYHPSGFIVGVNAATGKLHKLRIPGTPVADNGAPTLSQAHAGNGKRPGLTQSPIAVCVTVDGTIVVLESGANRLQAFDVNGNPVAMFGPDSSKSYYATLNGSTSDTRLALGVDGAGYFFILTYTNGGSQASSFRVDVHAPDGTFLINPTGVNAATMDVDYWRNLFTLNYAALTEADGTTVYTDPALGRIQPSMSIFVPKTPSS
jgi:hypothetical protein